MKQLMTLVLSLLMISAVSADTWTDPSTGISWTYAQTTDTEATIGDGRRPAISTETAGELIIPTEINGLSVTRIATLAFVNCSNLTAVSIHNGVTEIGGQTWCLGRDVAGQFYYRDAQIVSRVTGECPNYRWTEKAAARFPHLEWKVTSNGGGGYPFGDYPLLVITPATSELNEDETEFLEYLSLRYDQSWGCAAPAVGGAFAGCTFVRRVTVPSSVENIRGVFPSCASITNVTIAEGSTQIPDEMFTGCYKLERVHLPSTLESCPSISTVGGCGKVLQAINVDEKNQCFKSVDGLLLTKDGTVLLQGVNGDVKMPESVTNIADGAFCNCSGLTSVKIPVGLKRLGVGAFVGCIGLTSVSLPNGVASIGADAFYDCSGLTSVTIPDSVTSIGSRAFGWCSGLSSVTIPNSVTNIGISAFQACSGLSSVTIPSSVICVGCNAFGGCGNLQLDFEGAPPEGFETLGDKEIAIRYNAVCELPWRHAIQNCDFTSATPYYPKSYVLPDGGPYLETTEWGNLWFCVQNGQSCVTHAAQQLSGVIAIPETLGGRPVTVIDVGAFWGQSNLVSITIYKGVTNIGEQAFAYCTALENVEILGEVTMSGSVWNLGKDAQGMFYYNDSTLLGDVTVNSAQYTWTADATTRYPHLRWMVKTTSEGRPYPHLMAVAGLLNDEERALLQRLANTYCYQSIGSWCATIATLPFVGCKKVRRLTSPGSLIPLTALLPDSYDKITNITLTSCYQSSVTIGAVGNMRTLQLRTVGGLSGCSSLLDVALPDDTEMIQMSAFSGCGSLRRITFPSGLKVVGDSAFLGCRSLESVVLPEGVLSVGMNAFSPGLGVSLNGFSPSLGEVVIPDGVEHLSTVSYSGIMTNTMQCSFYGCASITNVTLPSRYSVYDVFPDSVDKIVKVAIADGSSAIGSRTFDGCDSLTSVTVPASVTSVDGGAFYKKSKLADIAFLGDAPDFGEDVFYGTSRRMTITTSDDAIGWDDYENWGIPAPWGARTVVGGGSSGGSSSGDKTDSDPVAQTSVVVVSNVVVHYVMNSVSSPMAAPITKDVGIVNVMTEIKGGNIAIPDSWAENYPTFAQKFGSDFAAALTQPSGKTDAAGNSMLVWQDFVSGTDPTDEDDVFRASVTMVGGKPVVSYTPELSEAEKAKRVYTTYGKVSITDGADWTPVIAGHESDYNFFKVTVEMK